MRSFIISGTLAVSLGGWVAVGAQIPEGSPPPSYGPLASTVDGGPVNGYEVRIFRTHELTFGVNVPVAELQQILPPGYTAIGTAVNVRVAYQQRSEVTAAADGVSPGSYGPSSLLDVFALVRSPIGNQEVVVLVGERSTQASVNLANHLFGEQSTRLADRLSIEIKEEAGGLRFRTRVTDEALGLKITAEANFPAAILVRRTNDPLPIPVRFLNGMFPNTPFRLADQFDAIEVPTAGNFALHVPGNELRLPAGNLTILDIRPTMTIHRWRELFIKLEPGP